MSTRYPFWTLRYWWAACAILDEHKRLGKPLIVVDLGCERGIIKRFVQDQDEIWWIGLDLNVNAPLLMKANYHERYSCDLDKRFPLDDGFADIVICLHVFEHLPRPEFTMSEIKRILCPGGILLAGSPIKPKIVAMLQEKRFRHQLVTGYRKHGKHINAFWPKRWKDLVGCQGMNLEFMTGSHFLRWRGFLFENYRWWVRLNQIWGALFPSLGMELYFQARKTKERFNFTTSTSTSNTILWPKFAAKFGWLTGVAAGILIAFFISPYGRVMLDPHETKVESIVKEYQDGNDNFHVSASPYLEDLHTSQSLSIIDNLAKASEEIVNDHNHSKDSFFLISAKDLDKIKATVAWRQLSLIKQVDIEGERFVLLSTETKDVPIGLRTPEFDSENNKFLVLKVSLNA